MMAVASAWSQYSRLFAGNVFAIFATGIATVALSLLAFDLAGGESGAILGTLLSLKMAMNILVPLFAQDLAPRVSRKTWIVSLCLSRAGVLLFLPFVTAVWQVFALVVLFEFAAVAGRNAYLTIVADLLPDEAEYAAAAAKARAAYHVEGIVSPLIAAGLLGFLDFRGVFLVAVALFVGSAFMNTQVVLPAATNVLRRTFARSLENVWRLFSAPDVRAALTLAAAAILIEAMIKVNTVVLVRGYLGLDDRAAAIGLAVFGAGGIAAAVRLPASIAARGVRIVMLMAGAAMAILLLLGSLLQTYPAMLLLWFLLGVCSTLCHLPVHPLLQKLSAGGERQGIYAAHYSVDYSMLFVAYLLAGWIGSEAGLQAAFIGLGAFAAVTVVAAVALWPVDK